MAKTMLLDEALEELRKKAVDRAILLAAERRKKAGIRTGQTGGTRGSVYIYMYIYIYIYVYCIYSM